MENKFTLAGGCMSGRKDRFGVIFWVFENKFPWLSFTIFSFINPGT